MQTSRLQLTADWFSLSLRWLVLLGLAVSLAMTDDLVTLPNIIPGMLLLWNIALTLLNGLNRPIRYQGEISVAVDILTALAHFGLMGNFSAPTFWIIFYPLITAALYFGMQGALITAAVITLGQVGFTLLETHQPKTLIFPAGAALLTFALAAILGMLGKRGLAASGKSLLRKENARRFADDRLRAVYNLTSTLTSTLNYQRVIDSALDISLAALNAGEDETPDDRLVCAVLLFSDDVLQVGSARRFTPADLRAILAGKEGVIAQAIDDDRPILTQSIKEDPELSRIVALLGCGQVYCFPLRSGFNAYGVLLYGHPDPDYFTADRRELLDILGRQALIAIQNARLYQDLVDERDRMVEVQEEARNKLARDLHDGPTQSVAAMAMRVNLAHRMLAKDPHAAGEELVRIEDLARRTSKEIRHMLFTLRPLILESQGLIPALQAMADKTKETFGQEVLIQVDENILKDMEVGKQSVIFFIAEEAVNNARKHAQSPHITVSLRAIGEGIAVLEIQDNGVGFDVEAVNRAYDKRGSLGMINLRERSELVNGVLDIQSAPGKGTRVRVYIPMNEEAADRLHRAASKR